MPTTRVGAHPRSRQRYSWPESGRDDIDPILTSLQVALPPFVEGQLSNDEVSSDKEMCDFLITHGFTEEQARQALTYRDLYFNTIDLEGFTPITSAKAALHFNLHTRQLEPD